MLYNKVLSNIVGKKIPRSFFYKNLVFSSKKSKNSDFNQKTKKISDTHKNMPEFKLETKDTIRLILQFFRENNLESSFKTLQEETLIFGNFCNDTET